MASRLDNKNGKKAIDHIRSHTLTRYFNVVKRDNGNLHLPPTSPPLEDTKMEIETPLIQTSESDSSNIQIPTDSTILRANPSTVGLMNSSTSASALTKPKGRMFKPEWQKTYFWVLFNEKTEEMFCEVCKSGQFHGMWVATGATKIHSSTLKDHNNSEKHKIHLKQYVKRSREIKVIHYIPSPADETIYRLIRLAHLVITQDQPISFFGELCTINKLLGMDLGSLYHNDDGFLDLLRAISFSIEDSIIDEARESTTFGLLIDESTDISFDKNLIIYLRYFSKRTCSFKTSYFKLIQLSKGDADTIFSALTSVVKSYELHLECLSGIATDGASVMVGSKGGVCQKLKEINPYIISCHCVAHRLSLASNHAHHRIEDLQSIDNTTHEVIRYINGSPVRQKEFEDIQLRSKEKPLKLLREQEIRWISKYRTLKSI
jgi:hypothetical protein